MNSFIIYYLLKIDSLRKQPPIVDKFLNLELLETKWNSLFAFHITNLQCATVSNIQKFQMLQVFVICNIENQNFPPITRYEVDFSLYEVDFSSADSLFYILVLLCWSSSLWALGIRWRTEQQRNVGFRFGKDLSYYITKRSKKFPAQRCTQLKTLNH